MSATRAAAAPTDARNTDFLDLLRRDLTHATAATLVRDRATLTSHLGLDPATLAAGHEPVTVTYELTTIHDRRWLVRRQSPRAGVTDNAQRWTELICPDITAFSIRPAGGVAGIAPPADQRDAPKGTLPAIVTLHTERANAAPLDQTLVIR